MLLLQEENFRCCCGVFTGDRVLIGGTKIGYLRHLGTTDFAKGDWAGVELDDPIGKNDGAVAGKRYCGRARSCVCV